MNRGGATVSGLMGVVAGLACMSAASAASNDALSAQLHNSLQTAVSAGTIPGGSVLVSVHGKVVAQDAVGVVDPQSKLTLSADTVLWWASMSKPLTAAAIMMLVEAGKVKVDDPVSHYIPEFSKIATVRIQQAATLGGNGGINYTMVPAETPITVQQLLTHTSGLDVVGMPNPLAPAVNAGDTLATWAPHTVDIPLDWQPGTRWGYSTTVEYDLLARIVEIASGQDFNQFLTARIFAPLGMKNTGFRATRADLAERMPPIPGPLSKDEHVIGKTFFSGSAGLYGTLDDYRKFCEMLANGGTYSGKRLLKATSVAVMGTNQVEGMFHSFNSVHYLPGLGFGYGMAVVLDPEASAVHVPTGSYGWDGFGGTRFWISPKQDRVVVFYLPDAGMRNEIETITEKVGT